MEQKYSIEGIKCAGCVNKVNKVLKKSKVVKDYEVILETKTLVVNDKEFNEPLLIREIESLGYKVTKD